MKRTKPTKNQRSYKCPHWEFPGYMPNPPSTCTRRREFVYYGVEYINNTICNYCDDKCKRRKEFEHEWKEFWKAFKRNENNHNSNDMVGSNSNAATN